MIRSLAIFGLLLSLAFLFTCSRQPKPNIVIVTIDTLRADHLGCYGYKRPTSPRIDEIASRSIVFEKALCQTPQTLPSHTSIFTGMHPRTHKSITHESVVNDNLTTLAEILKRNGYKTAAFVSSHVLDRRLNLDQGLDLYWEIHKNKEIEERRFGQAQEIDFTTEAVLDWLRNNRKQPFMLWVHWFHPHRPYNPPPRYIDLFAGEYDRPNITDSDFLTKVWREKVDLSDYDVGYIIGCYDGEVAFSDKQVGRLIDEISSLHLSDKTIIVLTSDHGEILYEHEHYFGHDIALYEQCLWVPLIITGPGLLSQAKRIPDLVETIDIMPTLLDLAGIGKPKGIDGRSLLPLIEDRSMPQAEYFFSETFPFPEKGLPRHAVRTVRHKLIWRETQGEIVKELYDLTEDPNEEINKFSIEHAVAAHLDSVLAAWISKGGLRPAPIPSAIDAGRYKILKSLGYLD